MSVRERSSLGWLLGLALLLGIVVTTLLMRGPSAQSAEDRTAALAQRLRCPVCQSEAVADSPSPTALTMRAQIEEFVDEGRSNAWIIDHYVARYGRWILLDPPLRTDTVALWVLPLVVVVVGAGVILRTRRRSAPQPLSDAQRATLERELADWTGDHETRAHP